MKRRLGIAVGLGLFRMAAGLPAARDYWSALQNADFMREARAPAGSAEPQLGIIKRARTAGLNLNGARACLQQAGILPAMAQRIAQT
jgi:hypothetical protein